MSWLRDLCRFLFAPGGRVIEEDDDFAERLEANLAARKAMRGTRREAARKGWKTRRINQLEPTAAQASQVEGRK